METNIIQIVSSPPPSDNWTGVVALVAVAVSGLTAFLTYRVARRQIRDPIRAQWVELFREAVATYCDVLLEYIENYGDFHIEHILKQKSSDEIYEIGKRSHNAITLATRRINRIELLLDRRNECHLALLKELVAFMATNAVFNDSNSDDDPKKAERLAETVGAHIRSVLKLSAVIVTTEWADIATGK